MLTAGAFAIVDGAGVTGVAGRGGVIGRTGGIAPGGVVRMVLEGGVTGGTEIGRGGVGVAGATDGQGLRGVCRAGGSDAPSGGNEAPKGGVFAAGEGLAGVRIAGVGLTGVRPTGVLRGGADPADCPGTNGAGVAGRSPKAEPIASTGVRRDGVVEAMPTGITPPHVEQRARTPPVGTFAGSTR